MKRTIYLCFALCLLFSFSVYATENEFSDWGSVINYERVYHSSDFSLSSPDEPFDGILNVRINLVTREYKSEFKLE